MSAPPPPTRRLAARHGLWLWVLLLAALVAPLVLVPAIDLTVSSWFWDPARQLFQGREWAVGEWVRKSMPVYLLGGALLIAVLGGVAAATGKVLLGVSRRVAAYLLASLALGPGLVVNLVLKDHWGRPRPSTILPFGGPHPYVPPLAVSSYCERNCSFPSGHAALGFWLVAFALLAPPRWRPWAVAAAVLAGLLVGLVRIAQGGHFLSDVVFSALITIAISLWLHRLILAPADGRFAKNNPAKGQDSP